MNKTSGASKEAAGKRVKNYPNDWSDDPHYIVDLIKRVTRVSVETVRIVSGTAERTGVIPLGWKTK